MPKTAAPRTATTFRLDGDLQAALVTLSKLMRKTQNQLVNEAVRELVVRRSREVEVDLGATLAALRAYRERDPRHEEAIVGYAREEAALESDPAEGRIVSRARPARARARKPLDA